MIGLRFNRLLVVASAGKNKHGKLQWECVCDCGNKTITLGVYLRNGDTKSCGCLAATFIGEKRFKHGKSRKNNTEYEIWKGMNARCYNPNHIGFKNYGGRGIIVCDEWRTNFNKFLNDMGFRPSKRHSLDRFPNINGNYEPANCRWATDEQQRRNKRNNRYYTFKGITLILEDWSKLFNVHQSTLHEHLGTKSIEQMLVYYYKKGKITNSELIFEIESLLRDNPEMAEEIKSKLKLS